MDTKKKSTKAYPNHLLKADSETIRNLLGIESTGKKRPYLKKCGE